jgi:hypothetical protein
VTCCDGADEVQAPADLVIGRLEEAGATLLTLPLSGCGLGMRGFWPEIVREFSEAYGWTNAVMRPAVPAAATITRMDEALAWISRIPQHRYVLRRIVGARSLVAPMTGRHMFTWRKLAGLLGADHHAVQRWHGEGIALIVASLRDEHFFQ